MSARCTADPASTTMLPLAFSGPRRKITFKRKRDKSPEVPPAHSVRNADCFIAAARHGESAQESARLMLEAQKAHDAAGRVWDCKARPSSILCFGWTHGLMERERLRGDAADVAIVALQELLEAADQRNCGILLDGLAQARCQFTASAAAAAEAFLLEELERVPPVHNLGRAARNRLDIARQFGVKNMSACGFELFRDALFARHYWVDAWLLCRAVGREEDVLTKVLSLEPRHHDELVPFVRKLDAKGQGLVLEQVMESGANRVADRLRRACDSYDCPATLRYSLRLALLQHLLSLGLHARAKELAAEVGMVLDPDVVALLEAGPADENGCAAAADTGRLPLWTVPQDAIHLVCGEKAAEDFAAAVRAACASGCAVGLDCEWQPGSQQVSICQLAIGKAVWIVDVLWVKESATKAAWTALHQLLADASVLKLGFGLQEDVDHLHFSFHDWGGLATGVQRVLDFNVRGNRGLARTLQEIAHVRLDKALQCSAWGTRPLSKEQLQYAAADAQCLLHLFDCLSKSGALPAETAELLPKGRPGTADLGSRPVETNERSLLVVEALQSSGIDGRLEDGAVPDPDIPGGNVVCFIVKPERRPVAVVTREAQKVSMVALAKALGCSKNKLSMASADECLQRFGFPPGNVPPLGLHDAVEVWLSTHLRAAGGLLRFASGDLATRLLLDADGLAAHFGRKRWLPDEERSYVPLLASMEALRKTGEAPRFAVDSMNFRLASRLRALGVDTAHLGAGDAEDLEDGEENEEPTPATTATAKHSSSNRRAEEEQLLGHTESGRIALSSATSTLANTKGFCYRMLGVNVDEQLREVCQVFGVQADGRLAEACLHRCLLCNSSIEQGAGAVLECTNPSCGRRIIRGSAAFREILECLERAVNDLDFPVRRFPCAGCVSAQDGYPT
eukprot:TRINITY_DN68934_c0_g1_i3.p1 TRINITY_DN68934_c0_g1~~TRINITY_DN68934_c0_g1_i3.p1  ORF type:complete len:910 (-),score=209.11 TRINITY_DN68934_c0_g1_i3:190-2919(-)